MGLVNSIQRINYEDIQYFIKNSENISFILINTLNENKQNCLIPNTIKCDKEEEIINNFLSKNKNIKIVIYGENSNDNKSIEKYLQLQKLGFNNVYIYCGGLFEWLLLKDIYGDELFPTTSKIDNPLIYKPEKLFNNNFLMIDT